MKISDQRNYFARFLKKKELLFKASRNKKEPSSHSTLIMSQNPQQGKRKESSNQHKQGLNHKKTISTPIDLTKEIPVANKTQLIFEEECSNEKPKGFRYVHVTEPKAHLSIDKVKQKVNELIEIIEAFERDNNLNVTNELFANYTNDEGSNTERYGKNTDIKRYISPPNSIRFNKTINNLSLSSKESTHYLSKKISLQMNTNLNERMAKGNVDDNNTLQYKSYSLKKSKHNYHKIIGLKQNMFKPRTKGEIIHLPSHINPKSKLLSQCCHRENSYTNKYIKHQTRFKGKTEENIRESPSTDLAREEKGCNAKMIVGGSHSKTKHTLMGIPIRNFVIIKRKEEQTSSSHSQCLSERNSRNKVKGIFS